MQNRNYLDFKEANCKNCYKCLRECPVKAIAVKNDQARIDDSLCILCGHCAGVCRFNAKQVVDDRQTLKKLFSSGKPTIASIAPAYVSSFDTMDFETFTAALIKLGFSNAEETARGAHAVTGAYKDILDSHKHKNLIASACPSIVRLIQLYYPNALPYLAKVDSPMVAHAKLLREKFGKSVNIVFIGPCIAKKREADESGIIDACLTFEELKELFDELDIKIDQSKILSENTEFNKAKYYPINRGIIKSFEGYSDGYEYVSIDGVARSFEVLENIESLEGMFIEMHACQFSCINGPCALNKGSGGFIKATEQIRRYVKGETANAYKKRENISLRRNYLPIKDCRKTPSEYELRQILASIGKLLPEDELNCGACGYNTCRDKATAVYNGMAELQMCVPFMRERAENMSYDIIHNSPNGIIAIDENYQIIDINSKAMELFGITCPAKGEPLERFYNPTDFYLAMVENEQMTNKKVFIEKTDSYVEMSIRKVEGQNMLFCIMKDVTGDTNYKNKLDKVKSDTIATTNDVIAKQMRVVQEIASLLGETTAETKIALIKLKKTLEEDI